MKICYCFNHTEQDIIDDVRTNRGRCLIMEKILASKKGGACRCDRNHPQGK